MSLSGSALLFGLAYFGYQSFSDGRARSEIRDRLEINKSYKSATRDSSDQEATGQKSEGKKTKGRKVANNVVKKTNDFYSTSDPKAMRKLQMSLIQAGYLNPASVGYFLAIRFGLGILGLLVGVSMAFTMYADLPIANRLLVVLLSVGTGYFLPNMILNNRVSKLRNENRSGFPDVMDLMVVAAEAGLTTEASIERIAKEIEKTHPILSTQLNIAALEVRAGRPLDQALHSFGERLGLEEIQGFATMIQQSKELGTSVSDALRVYSDEMRHKRMMRAEEKAYALPAKLSIPVTLFILPIVVGVAVIPTVVRMMTEL